MRNILTNILIKAQGKEGEQMKKGTTPTLVIRLSEKIENIKSVIISFRGKYAQNMLFQKTYPESGTLVDGRIYIPLSQKETDMLPNKLLVECQINLASGAVAKTDIKRLIISDTLATEYIDGAASDGNEYNVTFSLADKIENDQLWRPHVDEDGILTSKIFQ